jgi:hypothetical protein
VVIGALQKLLNVLLIGLGHLLRLHLELLLGLLGMTTGFSVCDPV